MQCIVAGCSTRGLDNANNVWYERFPDDPIKREAWCKSLGVDLNVITARYRVCSLHFPEEAIVNTDGVRSVIQSAIPIVQHQTLDASTTVCCIPHCPSTAKTRGICWLSVPHDRRMRELWSDHIGEEHMPVELKDGDIICYKHFKDACIVRATANATLPLTQDGSKQGLVSRRWKLTSNAFPTIFPPKPNQPATTIQQNLFQAGETWDFKKTCRTCSVQITNNDQRPLFKGPDSVKVSYPDVYRELIMFGLKINENDHLPQQLCRLCIDSFSTLIQFRRQCRNVEAKLEEYYMKNRLGDRNISTQQIQQTIIPMDVQPEPIVIDDDDDVLEVPKNVDNEIELLLNILNEQQATSVSVLGELDNNEVVSGSHWFSEYYMRMEDVNLHSDSDSDEPNTEPLKRCHVCRCLCPDLPTHMKYFHGIVDNSKGKNQIRPNPFSNVFACDICNRCFDNERSVDLHRDSYHFQGPIKCSICEVISDNLDMFRVHQQICRKAKATHIEKRKKCNFCGYEFKNHSLLVEHERKHTGEKPFLCDTCGASFPYDQGFREHVKGHLDANQFNFMCDFCDKKFQTRRKWRQHRGFHTQGGYQINIKCKRCVATFIGYREFYRHLRSVHQIKNKGLRKFEYEFSCRVCTEFFGTYDQCKKHIQAEHSDKLHLCFKCQSSFADRGELLKHIQLNHIDEMAVKCGICDKEFSTLNLLQEHVKIHTDIMEMPDIIEQLGESDSGSDDDMKEI